MKSQKTIKYHRPFNPASLDIPVERGSGYAGVSWDYHRVFSNGRRFRIAVYGMYCAKGLYGAENNGIVILDEDKHQVVLDQHMYTDTGYFGPTVGQESEFHRICSMNWTEFQKFVNSHHRTRNPI